MIPKKKSLTTAVIENIQKKSLTLLTMVQGTDVGRPAKSAACLSGAWPNPAERTQPM